ncbi:MAG TPA: S9 family peptidase [Tenuifilaceae bacterium]|nr:S9 family peptidase [Tenuifilaceae bacterium]
MRKVNLLLMVMAFAATFQGCQQADDKGASAPIQINNELTADEISKGILSPEVLWKFGRVSGAEVSPCGKMVVYGISRYSVPDNKGVTNLFIVDVEGGEPRQLTDNAGSEFDAHWRPDGKRIGFISTRGGSAQMWEMNPDGTDMVQVTNIEDGINTFKYAPSGDRILYTKDVKFVKVTGAEIHPDMPKSTMKVYDNLMARHWDHWEDGAYSHIFVADYNNGKVGAGKDIMEGEIFEAPLSPYFDAADITFSPCGKMIVYACKKQYGRDFAVSTNSDLFLYNIETGETKNLTEENVGYDKYPAFSPDGKMLAWQSMETPGYESDKHRLFVMDLATGTKQYLTKNFDQNADQITWSADGKFIYFISGTKGTEQLYKMDPQTLEIVQITTGKHNYSWFGFGNGALVAQKMSMSMAAELVRVDEATGADTQLTFTNKNIYENIKMGEVQERWVKTTDGKDMLVWVILPPNFDATKKYPALLYCQGGPQSTVGQFFSYRWNFQIMAAHGYVVVAPNRRGVPSFGQEWNAQISGDYSGQNIKDYLSAIDDVAKESWVDADRLGAVGASYGGYSVYYLAGMHNKRFKAFIAHNGMYNFESFYAATEETFFPNHDFGGSYWDKENKVAQRTFANSPHKLVQNWDTPIMVIVGENDFRIPYTEGLQAFNAAQLRGVPSKLLMFHNENHFVTKPQNAIIWQREFFGWLDQWLKK